MKNRGIITKITQDSITIEIFKDISCLHCNICDKKIHSIQTFPYKNNDFNIGDVVEFSIGNKQLLQLGFLVYISPIIFMIIFYSISYYFHFPEGKRVIITFLGLIINLIILYSLDKIKGNKILNNIKITKEKN